MNVTYVVLVEPDPDGSAWLASTSIMPRMWSRGPTPEAAVEHLRSELESYLRALVAAGEEIPRDRWQAVPVTLDVPPPQ